MKVNCMEAFQTYIKTNSDLYNSCCWTGIWTGKVQDIFSDKCNFILEDIHKIITGEGSRNACFNRMMALSQPGYPARPCRTPPGYSKAIFFQVYEFSALSWKCLHYNMELVSWLFIFPFSGATELSQARRVKTLRSVRWSSWEGLNLRYDPSVILGYGTQIIEEGIISLRLLVWHRKTTTDRQQEVMQYIIFGSGTEELKLRSSVSFVSVQFSMFCFCSCCAPTFGLMYAAIVLRIYLLLIQLIWHAEKKSSSFLCVKSKVTAEKEVGV